MRLLYFGWVRARIGISGETLDPPRNVIDVYSLIDWLKMRGGGYQEALEDPTLIRVAVNQEITTLDTQIHHSDEVALFPPMTGG
ncbi:MAG: molybdopterin converting factor subunit 1 [Pseudomonadota bacterium]|nr:molybdopterin converting factor subunit 1 [Pseudomonadota bacterium]|tara:strand:+ start:360 stop:611 length:252 start_codon:yes stop_codon:yes gene_type:complete